MRPKVKSSLFLLTLAGLGACQDPVNPAPSPTPPEPQDPIAALNADRERLVPLHAKLGPPKPNDWLARYHEPGQTFAEYLNCNPALPRGARRTIYIQPLGDFTEPQRKIVELSAEFMSRYFNLPVKIRADVPLSEIPARARRVHPTWGDPQILSTHVLDHVLRPRLPDDAAAMIAFTASDLWPGEGWNFVFGQASLRDRVGVWSIYRNGDPETEFRICLRRTLKTATHETGHMFSIQHCTAYECNMCGSNHREESDRHPLWLCPECVAKVVWATEDRLVPRYKRLAEFCEAHGLEREAAFYTNSARALVAQRRSPFLRYADGAPIQPHHPKPQ